MNFSTRKKFKRWTSTIMAFLLIISTFLPNGFIGKAEAEMADHIVISQVFGGGGNSGAPYNKDFIELYNPTDQEVSLVGWSVQYASATGSFTNTTPLNKTIPAHGYYLIGQAGGSNGIELPTPDDTGSIAMSGTNGKVRLVNVSSEVVDLVGFGSATTFEGLGATKALSNSTSAQRRPYSKVDPAPGKGNAWDSNDNAADFFVGPVAAPRNTASPGEAPMVPDVSLDPKGLNLQFIQNGTSYKVTGTAEAAPALSTIKVYESADKATELGTATVAEDGSFEVSFSSSQSFNSVLVAATQGSMDESAGILINKATASAVVALDKLSYMVASGNGTLIGNAGAAVDNSIINVYPNAAANPAERLVSKEAAANGSFNLSINNAPSTVYVTQISSSSKGIMLESAPVAIEKAVLDTVTPLNEVKATDGKGILTNLNSFFTVEGIVTVQNGVLGTQKNNFYIQDETGGINVFGSFDSGLTIQRGDKLKVTGKVIVYNGLTEFEPTAIIKVSEGNPVPVAKDMTILDLNTFTTAEPLEGSLVKVGGKVSAVAATGTNYNVTVVDENNKSTTIRVMGTTGIKPDTDLVVGNSYSITGIVGQYTTNASHLTGYQVFPRDAKDITAMLNLSHTPLTEVFQDTNIEFVAAASGAESVTVYYRAKGVAEFTALPMTSTTEGRYTAALNATDVPAAGFEYYIEAKNGDKTQGSGTNVAPHQVVLVADTFAPAFLSETPANGTRVESPRPEVSVVMEDPSEIDTTTVKVWFDGTEITNAIISKKQVKFTPGQDLEVGIHTVKVEATDLKGNTGAKEWTFEAVPRFTGGKHFRGTTHNHTNISHDGAGTPQDAVNAGKRYGYDWFAFSDHSHDIDPTLLGQDTVEREGTQERTGGSDWQLTKDLAAQHTVNGEYVVFPAFEMTSTVWGHSNIFGSENFIDRNINGKMYNTDVTNYYAWVMTYDDIVGQFNHPDMSNNAFNNFKPYNKDVDKLFTMLEVGNGSGHYAYANAEKKFFSVLDLGWHVAPTYGEDNHEGTWGKTRARTVIVADDLSQASLLHSMRNMRVYMVEDPNFTLDVLANGYYMGSTVDSKELNLKISGSDLVAENRSMSEYDYLAADYKSDDRVEKVELITNGGVVVDSYSPMTKDFTWEPSYSVAGGQQWFVVRVTQADGERMYSAPVWSKEEAVDVKVNGIDVEGEVIIAGNPATLKANVSNNGTQEVQNVKVDLYYDEVKESNLIGTQTLSSIVSKGVGTATFTWNNATKGNHKLIAVASSEYGGNQFTLDVDVKEPLGIKVMFDAKHNNENTSSDGGTYANNLKAFTTLMQKEGYTVVENKETITDAVLSDVKVLVITHNRIAFTTEERAAVARFVQSGGSVLMAGKSNHSTDSTINNEMLREIGSAIRISSDGVFDDSKTGNFWSDPSVSPFAVRVFPGLVSNYITDRVSFIDYYSGVSLSGADNQPLTESGKVTILAKGNETTYQGNIKGGFTYDAVSDTTGGSAIPLIASEEIGEKGRIIVSGMNIFNDKQIDEAYEPKGNDEFSLNAINWLAGRETKVMNIGDARNLAEDAHAVIEGTVTTGAGVFFDAFYVQDETGGIMAFQEVPAGSIKPGDKVRIYGHIITFDGNKEIEFASFDQDVIKIGTGEPLLPKVVPTGEATSDANQGLLVKVKGTVKSIFDANSYVINDGSGDVLVFTDGYIVNQSGPVPVLQVGDTLEATGLSGTFADGTRIRVRDTRELIGSVAKPVPGKGKLVVGETPLASITFSLYSTGEGQWYDITSDANGEFTHNLPDGSYKVEGIWVDPTWYPLGKTITIQNGLVDGTKEFTIDALDYQIPTPEQGKWNVSGTLVNGTNALTHIPFSIHTLDGTLWYDTKSDSNGKFAFNLPDGSYEIDGIWVNSEGKWYVLDQMFTVKDGKLVGTTELAIDVKTMAPIDNVTGTLTKGTQALKNLTFSLHTATGEQIWYSATTDENGQFAFNLPDGSYIVEGIWNGAEGKWYVLQKEFTVSGTHSLNINVLTDVPPAAADNVTGVLTNGGAPLSNLVFSIHTTSGEVKWYDTTTDANGQFGFKLPDGTYKLEGIWVNSEGKWYNLQKEFTVEGTKVLNIDLSIN
jgi:DNA/RNA endonuclease YhcR with UshA esterase domain